MHLGFLERSCTSFDSGYHDEAFRIAVTVRVLLHDTSQSVSLLSHLGAKRVMLLSTSGTPPNPENVLIFDGLTGQTLSSVGLEFSAKLGNSPFIYQLPADEWWNELVLANGPSRFTRSLLVRTAANKDGGAHVDALLTPEYETLIAGFYYVAKGGNFEAIPITHLFALRQIGYELQNSQALRELARP